MITPMNDMVNRLCAEVCGYSVRQLASLWQLYKNGVALGDASWTETLAWRDAPDYCEDRNALPAELFQSFTSEQNANFGLYLCNAINVPRNGYAESWAADILSASPRQIAIAALKALSKWPSDWSTEEPNK